MKFAAVADTHAAVWFLSSLAKTFMEQAAISRAAIALAPISLAEVVYLVEKKRLPESAYEELMNALSNPNHVLKEAPFNSSVVRSMRLIPRDAVPDMPDRIVAATGLHLRVPVISRDGRIRASSIETIW